MRVVGHPAIASRPLSAQTMSMPCSSSTVASAKMLRMSSSTISTRLPASGLADSYTFLDAAALPPAGGPGSVQRDQRASNSGGAPCTSRTGHPVVRMPGEAPCALWFLRYRISGKARGRPAPPSPGASRAAVEPAEASSSTTHRSGRPAPRSNCGRWPPRGHVDLLAFELRQAGRCAARCPSSPPAGASRARHVAAQLLQHAVQHFLGRIGFSRNARRRT
jgi:hypothetical protein